MLRHRHLIVRGIGKASKDFEPYGGGSATRPSAVKDRQAHASRLRGDLQRINNSIRSARDEQRAAGLPSDKRGVSVAVSSRKGQELTIGESRRANSRGMQLLNVRRATGEGPGRDRAVYYMTSKAIESLDKSLVSYENWDDPADADEDDLISNWVPEDDKKRPRNFWLFESAKSFRVAGVEDLWTDDPEELPEASEPVEWEIWVRTSMVLHFLNAAENLNIELKGEPSDFVDIKVFNGVATKNALSRLISRSAAVVELRGASNFIADHADLPSPARLQQILGIADRIVPAPAKAPWVTVLDTGVNYRNVLLTPSLPQARCRAVLSAWDPYDSDGHGSRMAGVALFGDLEAVAPGTGPIPLEVGLESIAVFAPGNPVRLPARDAIRRGVERTEQDQQHPRVYCLAATVIGEAEDGRPTSTSGTLDALAFNNGISTRLFCVAVGNVETSGVAPYQVANYQTLNHDHGIQSPAQALNVLSVGALTNKCSGPSPLADAGGLSPRSRTAQSWEIRRHKPDILMEGGNHGVDAGGQTSRPHGPDMIATTSNNPNRITLVGDTSAACAAAARLAGRVRARYPAMRAETVRGLLAHCANWTPAMAARRQAMINAGASEEDATLATLDCFGWGVPDEERVFWSAGNALTLIAEDDLRPYKQDPNKSVTLKEMKSFQLPWPDKGLQALGATDIEMRCTLSYFVQPDIHSASLERLRYYPSHGLHFDFQRFEESEERALRRVNRAISTNDQAGQDDGWLLGRRKRSRGTLHHDIWKGPAYQLAGRRQVSVAPIRGWWASSSQIEPANVPVRFSLIISIRTPESANDLVAEVRAAIPASALVDVPSVITV
ncbi:S8 family peptidase [Sphingomonas sp. MMS24-J45]|uniref:S8 family peptidase n=1 Tax=Sphingomonas sp. MMS24-J45 TaxID=3238806 RepID=UPI00384BA57D